MIPQEWKIATIVVSLRAVSLGNAEYFSPQNFASIRGWSEFDFNDQGIPVPYENNLVQWESFITRPPGRTIVNWFNACYYSIIHKTTLSQFAFELYTDNIRTDFSDEIYLVINI